MKSSLTYKLTFKYMNIQIAHNLLNCVVSSYAAIFLKFNGFSNTEIGMALSAAAVISIIIQPTIASFADRTDRFSLRQIVMAVIGLNLVFGTVMLLGNDYKLVVFIIYMIAASIQLSLTSLSNSLAIEFINKGILVNYGLARGIGSLGFSIFSVFLGIIIGKSNPNVLIPIFMILYCFYFISVYVYRLKPYYNQYSTNTALNNSSKDLQVKEDKQA